MNKHSATSDTANNQTTAILPRPKTLKFSETPFHRSKIYLDHETKRPEKPIPSEPCAIIMKPAQLRREIIHPLVFSLHSQSGRWNLRWRLTFTESELSRRNLPEIVSRSFLHRRRRLHSSREREREREKFRRNEQICSDVWLTVLFARPSKAARETETRRVGNYDKRRRTFGVLANFSPILDQSSSTVGPTIGKQIVLHVCSVRRFIYHRNRIHGTFR